MNLDLEPRGRRARRHVHPCPGECGRDVGNQLFACGDCWTRLPYPYQRAISSTFRRDGQAHAEAMLRAHDWYRANPM